MTTTTAAFVILCSFSSLFTLATSQMGANLDSQRPHQMSGQMQPQSPQMGNHNPSKPNDDDDEEQVQTPPPKMRNFTQEDMDEATRSCLTTIKEYVRPKQCCQYPQMTIEGTSAMVCFKECEHAKNIRKQYTNCTTLCMIRELKLIDGNNAMVVDSWTEFYLRDLDRNKLPRGNWTVVVKDSVVKCAKNSGVIFFVGNFNF
jgi:hypothetical protein